MNGYLDTDGNFRACESYGHLELAYEIVNEEMNVTPYIWNTLDAENYLQKLGWIVVRTNDVYGLIGFPKDDNKDICYHLTDAQKKWLNEHYEEMTSRCRKEVDKMFEYDKW